MKTTLKLNIISNSDDRNTPVNSTKMIVIFIISVAAYFNGFAQNKFGIEAVSTITGSGHGTQYSPRIFYNHQKSTISIGAIIQKQKPHLSGAQIEYQYSLYGGDQDIRNERLELFCFINSIYNYAYLGKNEIKREESLCSDKNKSFIDFKYKTIENYVGVGLKLKITNNILWSNAIGLGVYHSFENNDNNYHAQQDFVILLRTGLSVSFKNKNIKK